MMIPTIIKKTAIFGAAGVLWAMGASMLYFLGKVDGTDEMITNLQNLSKEMTVADSDGNEIEFRPASDET